MDTELEKKFFYPILFSYICWFCIWNGRAKEESKTIRKREAEADQQQTQGLEREMGQRTQVPAKQAGRLEPRGGPREASIAR